MNTETPQSHQTRISFAEAVETARLAFFASLAAQFPQITSGDFSPEALCIFDDACEEAARLWLKSNLPLGSKVLTEDGYTLNWTAEDGLTDGDLSFPGMPDCDFDVLCDVSTPQWPTIGDALNAFPNFAEAAPYVEIELLQLDTQSNCGKDCLQVILKAVPLIEASADVADTLVQATIRQLRVFYFG